jgi:hypothetical protein
MIDPQIYLAIDNCFASKRWTRPADWATLIADIGISYVECSADTECDPLYMGKEYTKRWINQTKDACKKAGIPLAVTALSDRAKDLRQAELTAMAVVIGSEGQGVRKEILESADNELIIPMNPDCESLNAAIAAAIVMWQMKQ